MQKMDYLSSDRVELIYELPSRGGPCSTSSTCSKSRTKGYASLDYEPAGTQTDNLVRSMFFSHASLSTPSLRSCTASKADDYGRKMTAKLRELIPRQLFDVSIQAAIGGRIVARETVKAKRKDVLAK